MEEIDSRTLPMAALRERRWRAVKKWLDKRQHLNEGCVAVGICARTGRSHGARENSM
jgi:hypothetical protein